MIRVRSNDEGQRVEPRLRIGQKHLGRLRAIQRLMAYVADDADVERVAGRPFAAELTGRIVRRLRLEHTAPNPREVDRDACRAQISWRLLNLCGTEQQAERARGTFAASGLDRASADRDLAFGYARRWGRQLWPACSAPCVRNST